MQLCQSYAAMFRLAIVCSLLIVVVTAIGCSPSPASTPTPVTFFSKFSSPFECDIPICWKALEPILLKRGDKITALVETRTDEGMRVATARATTTDGFEILIKLQASSDSTTRVQLESSRPLLIEPIQIILRDLDDALIAEK